MTDIFSVKLRSAIDSVRPLLSDDDIIKTFESAFLTVQQQKSDLILAGAAGQSLLEKNKRLGVVLSENNLEINSLQKDLEYASSRLEEYSSLIQDYEINRTKYEDAMIQSSSCQCNGESMDVVISNLKSELSKQKSECSSLKQMRRLDAQTIDELTQELTSSIDAYEFLRGKYNDVEKQKCEAEAECFALNEENEALTGKIHEQLLSRPRHVSQSPSPNFSENKLINDIKNYEERENMLIEKCMNLEVQIQELKAEKDREGQSTSELLSFTNSRCMELQTRINDLENIMATPESSKKKNPSSNTIEPCGVKTFISSNNLSESLESEIINAAGKDKIDELERSVSLLTEEKSSFFAEITRLESIVNSNVSSIAYWEDRYRTLELDVMKGKQRIVELESELERLSEDKKVKTVSFAEEPPKVTIVPMNTSSEKTDSVEFSKDQERLLRKRRRTVSFTKPSSQGTDLFESGASDVSCLSKKRKDELRADAMELDIVIANRNRIRREELQERFYSTCLSVKLSLLSSCPDGTSIRNVLIDDLFNDAMENNIDPSKWNTFCANALLNVQDTENKNNANVMSKGDTTNASKAARIRRQSSKFGV